MGSSSIMNSWKKCKLETMADEVRDLFDPIKSKRLPYIGLEHIGQETLQFSGGGNSKDTVSTKKHFKSGEILFGSLRPYFRKVVQPKFDGVCSTDITVIRPKPNCISGFMKYLVASETFIAHASNISSGTRMPRANWKILCQSEWLFPPLSTQRKIATVLSAYDDLIENNQRRIKILEEMAQNLYREWFVKFRFPGHQNTRFVDSPLGKIPAGWEAQGAMENKNWAFLRQNISPFSGTKRYFATADINAITITGEGIPYTYPDKPSRAQKQPTLWSVWFARMQETYKVLGVAQSNAVLLENCMLSSGFAGFESADKKSFAFLFLTINSENFHREKDRFCTGTTQRSLTNDGLSRIQTISPPREVVRKFGGGGGGDVQISLN